MFVIAGASGRTGRVVAETLLSRGERVRLVTRDATRVERLAARGAEVVVASLEDERALGGALEGATGFYALLPEDLSTADFHAHRRRMVDALVGAVRRSRVPHVVFLSAPAAMLPDGNGPAKDLYYAEQSLRSAAPKLTIIRASYFQDNVLGAAHPARHEGVFPSFFPSRDAAFPTVATRDVGRIAARLLVEPPDESAIVDLVGPAYSANDMAQRLGDALGKSVRVVDVPAAEHVEVLVQKAGLPKPFAEALAEMFACFAAGRVSPEGDRLERGATTLDEVLREGLATHAIGGGSGGAPGGGAGESGAGASDGSAGQAQAGSAGSGGTADIDASGTGGTNGDASASDASVDAQPGSGGASADGCTALTYHMDADGDGYGSVTAVSSCGAPDAGWVQAGGDCNDGDPNVHPGQVAFFGTGYLKPGTSTLSFDYDCSGKEEEPSAASKLDCKVVNLQCVGSGYLVAEPVRSGSGVDPYCGSEKKANCGGLLCGPGTPYGAPKIACH